MSLPKLPDARAKLYQEQFVARNAIDGTAVPGMPYRIEMPDGDVLTGITDERGLTQVVATTEPQSVRLFWCADPTDFIVEDVESDEVC